MVFGDLKTAKAQHTLNEYLADKSYIEGYVPSQADSVVFAALSGVPPPSLPHLLRWYTHIKSFGADVTGFPGIAKPVSAYGPVDEVDEDDDDDFDIFGDDADEEELEKIKQERVAAYEQKKANKPKVIAKSNIIYDVKPWDDETDMKEVESHVRSINMDGLVWGASKLVLIGYGIKKLQITCVIEDDKVSTYDLEDAITSNEDLVQSVDTVAFNKV